MSQQYNSVDASRSANTLNKYFPVSNNHKIIDLSKSSYDIISHDDNAHRAFNGRSRSTHEAEYRDTSDIIKISPVKRHRPEDQLSLSMMADVSAYNSRSGSIPNKSSSMSPDRRPKDTSFDNVGERPDQPLARGYKRVENLDFTYSDKPRDPARCEYRFFYNSYVGSPECNVASAIKTVYEQYPETTLHGAVTNSHLVKRSDEHSQALYQSLLKDLGAGGRSTIHDRFLGEKNGKKRLSAPQIEAKHLLAWPLPVEEQYNYDRDQAVESSSNGKTTKIGDLRRKSKAERFSELHKNFTKQAAILDRTDAMNQSVDSIKVERRPVFENNKRATPTILSAPIQEEDDSVITLGRASIDKFSTPTKLQRDYPTKTTILTKQNSTADVSLTGEVWSMPASAAKTDVSSQKKIDQLLFNESSKLPKTKSSAVNRGFVSQMNSNYGFNQKTSQGSATLAANIANTFSTAKVNNNKAARPGSRPSTACSNASKSTMLKSLLASAKK